MFACGPVLFLRCVVDRQAKSYKESIEMAEGNGAASNHGLSVGFLLFRKENQVRHAPCTVPHAIAD